MTDEELAQMASYYAGGGVPGTAPGAIPPPAAPPPTPAAAPAPAFDAASYYGPALGGPPPAPAAPPAPPPPPSGLQNALDAYARGGLGAAIQTAVPPAPPAAPAQTTTLPEVTVAGTPTAGPPGEGAIAGQIGPPIKPMGYATSDYARQRAAAAGAGAPRDAFGVGAAQKALLGTFATEAEAKGREGRAREVQTMLRGEQEAELARLKDEDAHIARLEQQQASDNLEQHLASLDQQLDAVRSRKIDPNRFMASSGKRALSVIGGMLGGLYQGLTHGQSNQFLDDLNHEQQADIDAQKADIANETSALGQKMNLVQQLRAVYKDKELADLQARNLMYEAAKQSIDANAAQNESPVIRAQADQAVNAIGRQQKQLQLEIAQRAKLAAQQQAAQAAAQARAARKEQFDQTVKLLELGLKKQEIDATARKGDKTSEQLQKLAGEMSKPEIVSARATIDDLKKKLVNPATGEIDGSRGIPGVGRGADIREAVAPPIGSGGALDVGGLVGPVPAAARAGSAWALGLSDEERQGRQEWNRLFDAYKVAVTGAGAGQEEIASLRKSFEGAKTPAEQATAIRLADAMLAERESRLKAGVDPDVARYYDSRVKQEKGARPTTVPRTPVR